jgi:hypothetical protein
MAERIPLINCLLKKMNQEFGGMAVILISLAATYYLFGQKVKNSFRGKFLYWLKSTIFLAFFLFLWLGYKEPLLFGWAGMLMSFGLSGVFTLSRRGIGAGLHI